MQQDTHRESETGELGTSVGKATQQVTAISCNTSCCEWQRAPAQCSPTSQQR